MADFKIDILGINASPRKYGNTYKLLMVAVKMAEKLGAKVKVIHIYDYRIEPCIGCVSDDEYACKPPCPLNDDMNKLLDEVMSARGLIIATPVYWYSIPGQLKNFIDRLTALENMIVIKGRSLLEGKIAAFIAVGNDHGAIMTIAHLMITLNSMGVIIPPWALAYYSKKGDALQDKNAVLDSANIGKIMVKIMNLTAKDIEWYEPNITLDEIIAEVRETIREYERKQYWERKRLFSSRNNARRQIAQER